MGEAQTYEALEIWDRTTPLCLSQRALPYLVNYSRQTGSLALKTKEFPKRARNERPRCAKHIFARNNYRKGVAGGILKAETSPGTREI